MNIGLPKHKLPVLIIIMISYMMIILDVSIVITALPKLKSTLGFSEAGLSWVQNAYILTFGGFLLLGARAGDILGRRRMFMVGLALFTFMSLIIGLSQSAAPMIVGRALQGLGSAILAPSTLALLSTHFSEKEERTRAIAYYAATAGVSATIGVILGGVFTDWLSWRVGFFINLPIGLLLIVASQRWLSETERHTGKFDLMGAFSSTFGMTSLVYSIIHSAENGWKDPQTFWPFLAGISLLAFFVVNEWRVPQPIMPLRLFMNRQRSGAYGARVLFLGAMMGFWFYMAQYLQIVLGLRALEAGLTFVPMTIVNFLMAAVVVPPLTKRFGNGRLLAGSLSISLIGMIGMSHLSIETPYLTGILLPMILIGIGQGGTLAPLTAAGIAGVGQKDAGAASGVVNVAHQVGSALGLSVLVAVFAAVNPVGLGAQEFLTHRIAVVFSGACVMLVGSLFLTAVFLVEYRRREE